MEKKDTRTLEEILQPISNILNECATTQAISGANLIKLEEEFAKLAEPEVAARMKECQFKAAENIKDFPRGGVLPSDFDKASGAFFEFVTEAVDPKIETVGDKLNRSITDFSVAVANVANPSNKGKEVDIAKVAEQTMSKLKTNVSVKKKMTVTQACCESIDKSIERSGELMSEAFGPKPNPLLVAGAAVVLLSSPVTAFGAAVYQGLKNMTDVSKHDVTKPTAAEIANSIRFSNEQDKAKDYSAVPISTFVKQQKKENQQKK